MRSPNRIIRIPEPCHESWAEMKPENNGRYCGSCEKLVVDFTGKTDQEIQAILLANAGQKTCGHFRNSQINRPLAITIDVDAIIHSRSPRKIFIAALLLTFGTGLFSCYDHQDNKMQIDRISIPEPAALSDLVMGDVKISESEQVSEENTDTLEYVGTMTGEVYDPAQVVDRYDSSAAQSPQILEKDLDEAIVYIYQEPLIDSYTTGRMRVEVLCELNAQPLTNESIKDSVEAEEAKFALKQNDDNINPLSAEIIVYPNPSSGQFTLKYNLKERCDVFAELFDQQGRKLMQVVDIKSQHTGEYHIPVNLSSFGPDLYLLRLQIGKKMVISKMVIQR